MHEEALHENIPETMPNETRDDAREEARAMLLNAWNDADALIDAATELRRDSRSNALTHEEQRALIFRILDLVIARDGEIYFRTSSRLLNCFMPKERENDEPDIFDTYCEAMPDIWKRYPNHAHAIHDLFDQNAEFANPDVYLSTVARIFRDPLLPHGARDGAAAGLTYQAEFHLLPYLQERINNLETITTNEALSILVLLETALKGADDYAESSTKALATMLATLSRSDIPTLLKRKAASITDSGYDAALFKEQNAIPITNPRYQRLLIRPLSKEYYAVYNRFSRCIGLLPRTVSEFVREEQLIPLQSLLAQQSDPLHAPDVSKRHVSSAESYNLLVDAHVLHGITRDFGFPFHELTVREQVWFATSLTSYKEKDEARVRNLTSHFGVDGARAFLSTEIDDSFRDVVLEIAEKAEPDVATEIFHTFSGIAQLAQSTADDLGRRFFTHDMSFDANRVRRDLLQRACKVLTDAQASLHDSKGILEKLERSRADLVLFASMFAQTQKGMDVTWENIRGLALESRSTKDLSSKEREAMKSILYANWVEQAGDNPTLIASTLHSLTEAFDRADTEFYLLKKGADIAAFIRFDHQPDDSLYAGSLNVNPALRSSGIGEAMLKSTIDKKASTHVITAHVPAFLDVVMKYVNDFGLIITGIDVETTPDGTEIRDLALQRDDRTRAHYSGQHFSPLAEKPRGTHVVNVLLDSEGRSVLDVVLEQTARGYVGTHYSTDPLNPKRLHLVFEPKITVSSLQKAG